MAPDPPTAAGVAPGGEPAAAGPPEPLGLVLPTFPQESAALPGAAELHDLCRGAEGAGAGGLWACDHLYWHGPVLECLAALTVAAAATRRAVIGTCVLQLPLRQARTVAKQASALAHLSGGRFVLGVGSGSRRGEYEAAGADYATRGRALDDGIDELRAAWDGGTCGRGRGDGYRQLPVPGRVPVWVGGSSEAALRRAARRGDGWIPLFLSPGEYRDALGRLDKESETAGRDPRSVARALVAFVSVGGDDAAERGLRWMSALYGIPPKAFADHLVAGSPRSVADALERFFEAGAEHVAVFLTADRPLVPFGELAQEFAGRTGVRRARASATGYVRGNG